MCRYWIEQIGGATELEGTKPVLAVGTHADLISRPDRDKIMMAMEANYPTGKRNRYQVQGHFAISLQTERGISDLKAKLLEIALNHPKIGIGKVQVPRTFVMMQKELEERKEESPYLRWAEYVSLGASIGIPNSS